MTNSKLRIAADRGEADSQNNLGLKYLTGDGLEESFEKALHWFRLAAAQNHPEAQFNLGECFRNGWGVAIDHEEAARWFLSAAEQEFAPGQFNLANAYFDGLGLPQNIDEALKWYSVAAKQGNPESLYTLGLLNEEGEVVPQNFAEAARLYRLAGAAGCSAARYDLSLMYSDGRGVAKDDQESRLLCSLSADGADGGDARAQYDMALSLFEQAESEGDQGPDYLGMAAEYLVMAAQQGHPEAQFLLGECYEYGEGMPQNQEESTYWYSLAAEQGVEEAQAKLNNGSASEDSGTIKAICVKQPFANLIVDGLKTLEIRSWQLPEELVGQDVLLCVSSSPKGFKMEADGDHPGFKLPSGCAIAVICFGGCSKFTKKMEEASFSGWVPNQYAWEITDVKFIKPFPIKGKLKFFDVDSRTIEGTELHPMTFVDHKTGDLL